MLPALPAGVWLKGRAGCSSWSFRCSGKGAQTAWAVTGLRGAGRSCPSLWGSLRPRLSWADFKSFALFLRVSSCFSCKLSLCWWGSLETAPLENFCTQQLLLGGKRNWCEDCRGLLNSSKFDFMGRSLNLYHFFFFHFFPYTLEIRGNVVPGCFKSKWTHLPRWAWFNLLGFDYMTPLFTGRTGDCHAL